MKQPVLSAFFEGSQLSLYIFYIFSSSEKTAISFLVSPNHWTMGGSASSQATKDGDIENKDEMNFGLVNMSSDSSGTWNLVEIVTCIFVALGLLYLLSFWCQKHRQKRLARLTSALQTSGFQGVSVQPDVARIPVFQEMQPREPSISAVQPPPAYHVAKAMPGPVYPAVGGKSPEEQLGASMMAKYS